MTIGVRPESWRLVEDGEDGYPVKVVVVEELGADAYLHATRAATSAESPSGTGGDVLRQVVVRIDARRDLAKGSVVRLTTSPDRVHVFDTAPGVRLSQP